MTELLFNHRSSEEEMTRGLQDGCDWYSIEEDMPTSGKKSAENIWHRIAISESRGRFPGLMLAWRARHDYPTLKEYYSEIYQDVHSNFFIQPNIGRYLALQRLCSLNPLMSEERMQGRSAKYWFSVTVSRQQDLHQKFIPSSFLTELVKTHMIEPDQMTRRIVEQLREMHPDADLREKSVEDIVSEQIENLFTDLAKRISIGVFVKITAGSRFTPEICDEIIELLELDSYYPTPVLDLLYRELIEFAVYPRERDWGRIIVEDSNIELTVNKNAFEIPVVDNIDNNWLNL